MNVVDRDTGTAGPQGPDGDVAQPDGLFDERARGVILTEQVGGFIVRSMLGRFGWRLILLAGVDTEDEVNARPRGHLDCIFGNDNSDELLR